MDRKKEIKRSCQGSPDGVHAIALTPEEVSKNLLEKKITWEDAVRAQFCVYCGEAIW